MSYFDKGETVRLKKGVAHPRCPEGRADWLTAKTKSPIVGTTDKGVRKNYGWCLDRDLHGSKYWPNKQLEVV